MSGTPVFAGTRVPLENLLDYLAAGDSLERFSDHFLPNAMALSRSGAHRTRKIISSARARRL